MIINNEFEIGQIVFLKTDKDQEPRIIISIEVFAAGELLYSLKCGIATSSHYGFEMSNEIDTALKYAGN